MTCRDFLTLWNARLDDPSSVPLQPLDDHAAKCSACARLATGFRLIAGGLPKPAVDDSLSVRVLAAWEAEKLQSIRIPRVTPARWLAWGGGVALAAAVLFIAVTSLRQVAQPRPDDNESLAVAPRPWTSALADATAATLDLARETSAPAARLGQEALIAARDSESLAWTVPRSPTNPTSDVLQSMSRTVNSGMKPLSGSARRAFSFLTVPASAESKPSGRSRQVEPGAG